jgi:carbamoyltransferase
MKILGISAFYHDSAAAIIADGDIIAAAQEERFTRKKHDPSFPSNAIRFCLEYACCSLDDLDGIVFYDKPFLKFERLLETYCAFAPRGFLSFLMSMPVWIREKLFLKRIIAEELTAIGRYDKKKLKLLFSFHHLSHAASAFYPSPFNDAAILTMDGVGEWATASICKGEGNSITVLKELDFPHSPGLLYSAFTYYCGFEVNGGEYKLMGLAPFGNREGDAYRRYLDIIKTNLVTVNGDGSIFLNQRYFSYATGRRMVPDKLWKELFGFPRRQAEAPLEQAFCDLALAIQTIMEEIIFNMAREAKRITGSEQLCMAGGVALNCVANGKLSASGLFSRIFIQPAAGDAGGALGAALATHYIYFGQTRTPTGDGDGQKGSFLGTEFSDESVHAVMNEVGAIGRHYAEPDELIEQSALLLASGKVLGWHQGRMEFGPRALGARSILADARNPEMQKNLNLSIKYRESFRPFAPIVLSEDADEYFEPSGSSPYMLLVKNIRKERRRPLPEGYDSMSLTEKLYFLRSDIPSVTHVDFSARVQTVHRGTNERLWKLLVAFRKITGYAVLINTSFNIRDEPIVNSPQDAWRCFMNTEMDYLVIGNYILSKKDQAVKAKNIRQIKK